MLHQRGRFSTWKRESFGETDAFPHLARFIDAKEWHPWLIRDPTRRVQRIIQDIEKEEGKYAVKNTRVLEWVSTLALQAIINKGLASHSRGHKVFQTGINEDVWHHLDAYGVKKDQDGRSDYYGLDFTFDQKMAHEKAEKLGALNLEIRIPKQRIQVPWAAVYARRKVILLITRSLERALSEYENMGKKVEIRYILFAVSTMIQMYLEEKPMQVIIPKPYTSERTMQILSSVIPLLHR